ncbi:MAG: hypothetical protein E6J21_09040 [Chloroflexota bacterium]|nr:MAG: hypothetical protein E6J21_09040 [Chloroflexota bacterium]
MVTIMQRFQKMRSGRAKREDLAIQKTSEKRSSKVETSPIDIAPNDPIVAYFLSSPGATEIDKLHLDSPALRAIKLAGIKVVIPLISQGELVGLLNLGPRMSEQDYSTYDRTLLNDLATQAAPALRVAQLVREQRSQALERERIEQELRVARLIQQTLLPQELPSLPGWQLESYYQPARAVGGDFYDFIYFEDGRLGLLIGDVTDKGVPAALVMATTRSILRSNAYGALSPGKVLEQTNDLLHPDIPPKMFVTCLYAILDPISGQLQYANAGHDLPYWHHIGGISELRATGMPLGLMPGMVYEEKEVILAPGDSVLLYSDGLVEAHNTKRDMFGFPRLMALLGEYKGNMPVIDLLLGQLADIDEKPGDEDWRVLTEMSIASEPGNERQAMEQVGQAVQALNLPERRLEKLKTAVAEATMNAMEHGNKYQPDKPVTIQVLASHAALMVRIRDQGNGKPIAEPHTPDLEAKLAELQSPRGWGLFLIKNLVDDVHVISDEHHHTLELILYLEGDNHGSKKS